MNKIGANNGLVGAQHLMRAMGCDLERMIQQLNGLQQGIPGMANLADRFSNTGGITAPHLGQLISNGNVPGHMAMPRVAAQSCRCPSKYAPTQNFDFGASSSPNMVERLGSRIQGAMFERLLNTNPFARQQLEMMLGGRILPDGMNDGRIQVQPNPMLQPYGGKGLGGPRAAAAATAQGYLNQLNQAGMRQGRTPAVPGALPGMGGNPIGNGLPMALMGALRNLLNGGGLPRGIQAMPAPVGANAPVGGQQAAGANAPLGGNKNLYANGGRGGGGNMFGAGDPNALAALLGGGMPGGGAMTVEDQVTLMLMMIMKKMDKDIKGQAKRVEGLQNQQNAGGAGGQQGGPQGAPSIDVETMKLKRSIDKRSQMFDMLRQIIDKYNETAKNIIQSVGR